MCGIFGVMFPAGDPGPAMQRMQASLRHRGPDGEGIENVGRGVLGHLRLSILDLSETGAQPMWDVDRKVCITYNGEIYNFKTLRAECLSRGLRFRSTSDTEVILGQYLLHGEEAFARLNGMFAFCLFDSRSGEFFLVRDPMGIKPLYYAERTDGLYFASEMGALLRSGAVAPEIDPAALQAYLQLDFVPSPMSMVKGVRKLTGGMKLKATGPGTARVQPYAALEPEPSSRTFEGDLEEFERRIRDAVSRQLVADVPVGVFLSGGIDSSIVASVASEVSASKISTFSIGFEEKSFDETRYSAEVARTIGSDHHIEMLSARSMLVILPKVASITSEPVADGSIFPTFLLSRFTRGSVKVVLSGDGADELFAGYPTHRVSGIGSALARVPAPLRRGLRSATEALLPVSHRDLSLGFKVRKFLEGLHRDPILQNERWLGSFLPEELPRVLAAHEPAHQSDLEELLRGPATGEMTDLERLLRTDQRFYLQDGVLVKVDRASMASSLEVRVPFLDHEIVKFARGLRDDRKLRGGSSKRLLRQFVGRRFPRSIAKRPKKGFGAPLGDWFRGELREFVGTTLAESRLVREGHLNPRYVATLLEEHQSGRKDRRKKIFNLLSLILWWEFAGQSRPSVST